MSTSLIVPRKFHAAVRAMRTFFEKKGFVEVHTQNALSILAACEDPETVSKYNYQGFCRVLWITSEVYKF